MKFGRVYEIVLLGTYHGLVCSRTLVETGSKEIAEVIKNAVAAVLEILDEQKISVEIKEKPLEKALTSNQTKS